MQVGVEGKVILITGSTQGIGEAIALECARSGAAGIVVTGRDDEKGQGVVASIVRQGVEAHMVTMDLSCTGAAEQLFANSIEHFGQLDGLVNAAGITTRASMLTARREDWQTIFKINAEEPFFLMQQFIQQCRQRKIAGVIVNILSMNMHGGTRDLAVYAATKAALALITRNAAHQHRFDRIRINGVNVGWTDTPAERMMQAAILGKGEQWLQDASQRQPFGRLLSVRDVASLALFLLSERSAPMTGSIIDQEQWVSGGLDT